MAAAKTNLGAGAQYHVTGPTGDHVTIQQGSIAQTIQIVDGGNVITLSKANIADLIAPLTMFSTTGVLS